MSHDSGDRGQGAGARRPLAESLLDTEQKLQRCRCSGCGGAIGQNINLVAMPYRATWGHPAASNFLTGYGPQGVAICCDACIDADRRPVEVVELHDGLAIYHSLSTLESLGPEPTGVIHPYPTPRIYCLLCGRTSHSPDDVLQQYCGYCHRFHEAVVAKPQHWRPTQEQQQ